MSAALLARIEASAPRRPWCGPEKDRCRVRPLATALTEPYIQLNPPAHVYWLQFDIDKGEASHTWEDYNLPPPTYVAVNPSNGHAHIRICAYQSSLQNGRRSSEAPGLSCSY
ncbi:replication initiation protein [Bordetella bronchiseptica]|uniref:replication initiation protein n=1 Tax=Bordetella bronchiseptica TaxID=518 RepID=UPI0009B89A63